ncbi:KpsF/GutQ family sugar-phosphate isomerase [uncultured Fusobacterium sp.]|uniref:KpsF/GutQ family sugar-phosphate isomerase n=1 Tax=uncultured Fusobacterium sp. TaxID=159267 RepID=UPI0025F7A9D1|nr:KpsF/GutQ family sugar-phosphate isomerase [uncultured Fusobacterium sp.]
MEFNEVDYARSVFSAEIEELERVKKNLNSDITKVVELILNSKGKIVVTGIGKSGLIGKKIAATLASTGTLAIFMNSAEGLHGDLGMISSDDVVLAISNSGNSDEIVSLLPSIEKIGARLVAMTGNRNSKLGKAADYVLDIGVTKEACPLNLAPMSSTTTTLVMGDALAAILIKRRNFRPENFAVYHPGGSLGKRLLMKVRDIMKKGEELPLCDKESPIKNVILTMTDKSLGAVCVMNGDLMVGIITEGDIRRALTKEGEFFTFRAKDIMTRNFTKTTSESMAIDALELMENRPSQIAVLPVIDDNKLVGIVRVHDLLNVVGR